MSASSSSLALSEEPPHKKLRKGTHSCTECRRRKKSCVPRPATPGTCEECFARNVQCRRQVNSLGSKDRPRAGKIDLQHRVAELETALLSISQKVDATPRPIESDDDMAQASQQLRPDVLSSLPGSSPEPNPEAVPEHAPVLSLFDNSILSRLPEGSAKGGPHAVKPPRCAETQNSNGKIEKNCRTLLCLFPSQQKEKAILMASRSQTFWIGWQEFFPQIYGSESSANVIQFIADLKSSGSVQKIAKALLYLCTIQQETPIESSSDARNVSDQTEQILKVIDDVVLSDDELVGTIDGVECILLKAKYDGNSGRLRRAWLTYRRGIAFAQLLGFHKRLGSWDRLSSDSTRWQSIWRALCAGERFNSLILGLPYSSSEIFGAKGRDSEMSATETPTQGMSEDYVYRLTNIVGHIIDRNQQLPSNNMLPLTLKIEGEMIDLKSSMPTQWWEIASRPSSVASQLHSQLVPQFWYHQARMLLHLPYMLKATTSPCFQYNKTATLESARELIALFRVTRPVQGFSSPVCKCTDFQAFTAAMILVLNLLHHHLGCRSLSDSEAESDQDSISATASILKEASEATDSVVASEAARALDIFDNIKALPLPVGNAANECSMRVVIPYFGAVVLGLGTSLRDTAQKLAAKLQSQQLPTPSDGSLQDSSVEVAPPSNPSIAPMIPFDSNYGNQTQGLDMDSDSFADVDFNLDQDWSWYWNNIDMSSLGVQGTSG